MTNAQLSPEDEQLVLDYLKAHGNLMYFEAAETLDEMDREKEAKDEAKAKWWELLSKAKERGLLNEIERRQKA